MGHQVASHSLGGAPRERLLEGVQRESGALDRSERDDHCSLGPVGARRRKEKLADTAVPVTHTHARHAYPSIRLRLSDEVQNAAAGDDHEPLACVGRRPDAVGFRLRQPCRPDEHGHSAELVEREQPGQRLALHCERRLQLEEFQ